MRTVIAAISLSLFCGEAMAAVVAVGPGAFPGGSPLLTFTGLADGTEVNGLIVSGVQFTYSVGNGNVVIDGGPGTTNNIAPQNIVSLGNPTGVLTLLLPAQSILFGYGFAVLNTATVTNATTITLFSGITNVGSLSYTGVPDPTFAGGFAGIQSTLPFDRVQLTFSSAAAPAFAVDNIRYSGGSPNIPEPSTWLLTFAGVAIALRRAVHSETRS